MLIGPKQTKRKGKHKQIKIRYPAVFLLTIFGMKGLDSQFGESAKGVLTGRPPLLYSYIRENTLPHLLLWGGCPVKLGLGELGGLAKWRVEQ